MHAIADVSKLNIRVICSERAEQVA